MGCTDRSMFDAKRFVITDDESALLMKYNAVIFAIVSSSGWEMPISPRLTCPQTALWGPLIIIYAR